jgi:hypothetical protein
MQVRMPSTVVTEALYCQGNSGNPVLFIQHCLEKCSEACCRAFSQLAEQFPVIKEIPADNLGNAENVLPVRDGIKNVVLKMGCKLNYFFGMAGGTEPSATA